MQVGSLCDRTCAVSHPCACVPLQMSSLYEWLAGATKPAQASPEAAQQAAVAQRRMCEAFSQKPLLWLPRKPLQLGDRLKDSWRANLQPGAFHACQRQVSGFGCRYKRAC